ncbi:hypothetical protein [Bacillus thuringiensis]|uniref:hypothetical protein n=1 Tax=Bacillus thuringiensis TaxID=1428 RepID=UPI0026E43F06|nr:hypothetical protein [Bacillus thuringiensis]MDO6628673.1 hypothetical protein [Bacillus thuringiensis]MDO6659202.1 hypothetical protein [Bacillus thuringiensis]MDO6698784.1 hypothetical protein [Bacillus thuringiensis]
MIETIASLVKEGYTSGYYPNWVLKCNSHDELNDMDLEYIGELIEKGFTSGYEPAYWELEYNDESEVE